MTARTTMLVLTFEGPIRLRNTYVSFWGRLKVSDGLEKSIECCSVRGLTERSAMRRSRVRCTVLFNLDPVVEIGDTKGQLGYLVALGYQVSPLEPLDLR
jgi:hypothetical protein